MNNTLTSEKRRLRRAEGGSRSQHPKKIALQIQVEPLLKLRSSRFLRTTTKGKDLGELSVGHKTRARQSFTSPRELL